MTDSLISQCQAQFAETLEHFKRECRNVHTGRASAELVEDIHLMAYGAPSNIKSVASISIPEPRTIQIAPWDKGLIGAIEKAISESPLKLTPQSDGTCVRINMPMMTEEKRKDFVKLVKSFLENARIGIRQARQKGMDELKKMEKDKLISEDELAIAEKKLQETVDKANKQAEEIFQAKETEIMN